MQLFRIIKYALVVGGLFLVFHQVQAFSSHYSGADLAKGVVFENSEQTVKVTLPSLSLNVLDIYLTQVTAKNLPADLLPVSSAFNYYLLADSSPTGQISLKYQSQNYNLKSIYFWQPESLAWQELASQVNFSDQTVTAQLPAKKGIVMVLENPDKLYFGVALPAELKESLADYQLELKPIMGEVYPEIKLRKSEIFQFDLKTQEKIDLSQPLTLSLKYQTSGNQLLAMYYWDKNKQDWIALPSYMDLEEKSVKAKIHLPFARVALFEEPNQWVGQASWYAYKNGLYAASRDFSKGSKVRVTNITAQSKNFKKSIVVTINDYGPEEWTGRIIDLDKEAYRKIGYLSGGVMPVAIELIEESE